MTRSRAKQWATLSARVVVGTGFALASVAAVAVGVAAPWPGLTATPVSVQATPAPAVSVLACDGPLLALGRTVEQAADLSVAAAQNVIIGPAGVDPAPGTLLAPAGSQPLVLSAAPVGATRTEIAAAGSASAADADLRGFAASSCTPPLMESWLVAGATTTGANDLVVLANPGDVAATVQLTVFGADGARVPPAGLDRVIAAGTQVVLPLAGLLLNEPNPVVKVTSTGAPVRASLQASLTRVLVPSGVDQVGAIAAASTQQVLPAVTVVAAPDGTNTATLVRLLAPTADGEAVVRVRAIDPGGADSEVTVPLVAGAPSELALGDLPVGRYTVVVDASVPLVAGAWESSGFGEGADFAWHAPAPEISTPSLFAVPNGPEPTLTVANTGAAEVSVQVTSDAGEPSLVTVAAGGSTSVPVASGQVYRLEPAGPVHASVGFASSDALAGFAIWAADAAAPPLTVFP